MSQFVSNKQAVQELNLSSQADLKRLKITKGLNPNKPLTRTQLDDLLAIKRKVLNQADVQEVQEVQSVEVPETTEKPTQTESLTVSETNELTPTQSQNQQYLESLQDQLNAVQAGLAQQQLGIAQQTGLTTGHTVGAVRNAAFNAGFVEALQAGNNQFVTSQIENLKALYGNDLSTVVGLVVEDQNEALTQDYIAGDTAIKNLLESQQKVLGK